MKGYKSHAFLAKPSQSPIIFTLKFIRKIFFFHLGGGSGEIMEAVDGHLWLRILAAWLPGPVSGSPIYALPSGSHHPGVPLSPFSIVQGEKECIRHSGIS